MGYFPPIGMVHCVLHLTMNQPFSAVMSETYILLQRRDCKRESLGNCGALDLVLVCTCPLSDRLSLWQKTALSPGSFLRIIR